MAKGSKGEGGGELLQIVILTLGMTAGGFLLLALVLRLWMIPNVEGEVDTEIRQYDQLVKLLGADDMKRLRQQAEEQDQTGTTRSISQIIADESERYGIPDEGSGPEVRRPVGSGKNIVRVTKSVTVNGVPLRQIIQFTVAVHEAKKTIKIERLRVTRPGARGRRTQAEDDAEDSWNATIDFVDFVTET